MGGTLVETALESPVVDDGFDMDKPNWQTLPSPLHCMRGIASQRIKGQSASGTSRLGKHRTAHEYRQAWRTVHRSIGVFHGRNFFLKAKKTVPSVC